ncbi:MAG TPA: LysM peptidoglycan-binding domain-containing protein [Rickettsia endosymbiont of Pyrocoelia pectoralis]|nr:LysM peptidoglycan-binding domain-containing protein [Rickettsia endosymbiont of Pyrocoelia pectoralis]
MKKAGLVKRSHEYTVRIGDTLWSIAEKELGYGKYWATLYNANAWLADQNRIINEHAILKVGEVLNIPEY